MTTNRPLSQYWPLAVGLVAALLIGGCVCDFAGGEAIAEQTVVQAKEYTPPRTEYRSRWVSGGKDTPGHMVTDTVHHPARYNVFTIEGIELAVSAGEYHRLEKGAEIIIRQKVGRWTGIHYAWSLADVSNAPER